MVEPETKEAEVVKKPAELPRERETCGDLWYEFKKGIIEENPIFRIVLGLCPTLAVTTAMVNGIAMGLATTFVLLGSNTVVSLLRKYIPSNVRIPSYIVIIATFVTVADYFMGAYFPPLRKVLGIFVPLIVVNCVILGRAEAFASKNRLSASVMDALGMGLGFTLALMAISAVREILGNGQFFSVNITAGLFKPAFLLALPPGGFLTIGVLLGIFNYLSRRGKGA
jgi:electron transport complex protein RnfE